FPIYDWSVEKTVDNIVVGFDYLYKAWKDREKSNRWEELVKNAFFSDNSWGKISRDVEALFKFALSKGKNSSSPLEPEAVSNQSGVYLSNDKRGLNYSLHLALTATFEEGEAHLNYFNIYHRKQRLGTVLFRALGSIPEINKISVRATALTMPSLHRIYKNLLLNTSLGNIAEKAGFEEVKMVIPYTMASLRPMYDNNISFEARRIKHSNSPVFFSPGKKTLSFNSSSPVAGGVYRRLTKKQVELLELYALGNSRKGICELLDINVFVVQKQLHSISQKLTGVPYKKGFVNTLLLQAYKQHYFDLKEDVKRAVEKLIKKRVCLTPAELRLARAYVTYSADRVEICKALGIKNSGLKDLLIRIRRKLREAIGPGKWKISEILKELHREGYDLNPGPGYGGLRDQKVLQTIYAIKHQESVSARLTPGEINVLRSAVRIKFNKEPKLGMLRSPLSGVRKRLQVPAREGLSALFKKALDSGYDLSSEGITTEGIRRVIEELRKEEGNPLHPSQIKLLEAAKEIGLQEIKVEYADLARSLNLDSVNIVSNTIKAAKANLGIKSTRSEGNLLTRCVIVAAESGYIKCNPDELKRLKIKFERKTLTPYQKRILIMIALGLKSKINNVAKLSLDIRKSLGLHKQDKTTEDVISFALKNQEINEKDIINTALDLENKLGLSGIQYALNKGYLSGVKYLFSQFKENIKSLGAEELGLLSREEPGPVDLRLGKSILAKLNVEKSLDLEEVRLLYSTYVNLYGHDDNNEGGEKNSNKGSGKKPFERKWVGKYNNSRTLPDLRARGHAVYDNGNGDCEVKTLYDSYRWPTREEEAILGQECLKGNAEARELLAIIGMKIVIFRIQNTVRRYLRSYYRRYWDLRDTILENIFYSDRSILNFSNMRDVVALYDPDKGFRLSTLIYSWLPDGSVWSLVRDEVEAIAREGLSVNAPVGDDDNGFTLLDTLADSQTDDPLEYLERKEIIGYIVARYRDYKEKDASKAEDLFLAVLNIILGQSFGKVNVIKKALKNEGFLRWDIGREGIRQRVEKGKLILARILKEKGIVMPCREDAGLASPSVAGGGQKPLPGGLMSSSPVKRPKLTGQESIIFKEVVKEAIAGEFKGLFDRVVRNIAEEFMITLSRERVRNALSDVRRKFGIRVDK
ncbi:MAG: hypothetical protein PHV58_04990, partial [Candidatus Omnitrophica bacterium]|nr:hypothetical protein [Candidatus Omnitrophota bacterium]